MEFLQQLGSDARNLLPRMLWSVAIVGVAMVSGPTEADQVKEACTSSNLWIMPCVPDIGH